MTSEHYFVDENGEEHCLAPIPGCECMQCHWERHLIENDKRGENRIEPGDGDSDLFAYEESKHKRREQRRGDRWLERHGGGMQ